MRENTTISVETRNAKRCCTPLARVITGLCAGLLMCIMGIVSYTTFAPILEQQVKANLVIDPSNEVYSNWEAAPLPIYVRMYLFNYTNVEDIINNGTKPKLVEVGPFTYREYRHKEDIKFNDNGTVSYKQFIRYEFLPEKTFGSLDDEIFTLNVPVIGVAYKNRDSPANERVDLAQSLNEQIAKEKQEVFMKRKIRELLFEGSDEYFMKLAKETGQSAIDRFGYQVTRNNSNDGTYTIFTGATGMEKYGYIDNWNGVKRADGFRKSCKDINGTSGEMWPPYTLNQETPITFFVSPLCRSLTLRFSMEEQMKKIKVLRYQMDNSTFNYDLEENQCFCRKKKDKPAECAPNGVLELNRCQKDAPLVASLPHLLYADPKLLSAVEGLTPDESRHGFFMDVEPTMGVPVRVSARFQMNVIVDNFPYFPMFDKFPGLSYYPTFWIDTSAGVDDAFASRIRLVTEDLANYVTMASCAWVFLGLFCIICTLAYVISQTRKANKDRTSAGRYTSVKLLRIPR